MKILWMILLLAGSVVVAGESGADLQLQGLLELKKSQTNPELLIQAARKFALAGESYSAAGNDAGAQEANACLYWCKKKMTLAQMEDFLKLTGKDAPEARRIQQIDTQKVPASDARKYFDRAEEFAEKNPSSHFLIAVRYFEVANRFKGDEYSLKAQERSLDHLQKAADELGPAGKKADVTAAKPRPAWMSDLDPGRAQQQDDFLHISSRTPVRTKKAYEGPIEISFTARTNGNDIRVKVWSARLILNWRDNRDELRITAPENDHLIAHPKTGRLAADEWHKIVWRITNTQMDVVVDGKVIHSLSRDFKLDSSSVVTFQAYESLVDIKDVVIRGTGK